MSSSQPLQGLKILDFSTLLPGPCATMMMADLGAEVLRIESPSRVDLLRVVPPMIEAADGKPGKLSASHAYLNRSKKSVALDLKKEGASDVVKALLAEYDIVVEQFRPGVMKRLGLDYESLRAHSPGLIYCSITGYGQTGPLMHRAGHDINYLALAGVSSYSGRKESGPGLCGAQIADVAGGTHHAVIALLAAVIQRQKSGRGAHIDISMSDAALSLNHMAMAGFLATGEVPSFETEMLNGGGLYDYYETADGRYLSVGALEPQFLQVLLSKLGLSAQVQLFMSNRQEDRQQSQALVAAAIKDKSLEYWVKAFEDVEACVEPVLDLSESRHLAHFEEREMFCDVEQAAGNAITQLAPPLVFDGERPRPRFAGVALGAQTREVLLQAGFTDEHIDRMQQHGLFGAVKT